MPLNPGTRLGVYEVKAKIGEGGMGEVYQARDTKLNRDVALKVLPDLFASDPDRLARFQREAEVLASLNHPNIATIHGLEETADTRALVLELVEGPTLAERIAQGPIPLDETVAIASQIADALEAAHEQGVIHRDLKPANVKVKDDGTVKVLDFGLAKALEAAPGGNPSESPTLTAAATEMGVIMGTAAYMAPEQARGKVADKRADVWAFGVVVYEMLTGRRTFEGRDVSEVLAGVIKSEPEWDLLPKELPSALATYLRRCLEKDPRDRLRDIGDVRLAMAGAFDLPAPPPVEVSEPVVVARQLQVWQRPVPAATVTLALVAMIVGLAVWTLQPTPPQPVSRFSLSVPPSAAIAVSRFQDDVKISHDGTRVVYRAEGGVFYVRALDQLEGVPLRGAEGADSPFFSADGSWVGFEGPGNVLQKVSILGGPPVTLAELTGALGGGSWGPDDMIVFGSAGGLLRVSGAGGEPGGHYDRRRFLSRVS